MRSDIGPGDFKDSTGRVEIWDLPPFCVTLNFPMVDFENDVGPIRQIPGTHMTREMPPEVADEPEWMKLSTVLPSSAPVQKPDLLSLHRVIERQVLGLKAGGVVFRDLRAWCDADRL